VDIEPSLPLLAPNVSVTTCLLVLIVPSLPLPYLFLKDVDTKNGNCTWQSSLSTTSALQKEGEKNK